MVIQILSDLNLIYNSNEDFLIRYDEMDDSTDYGITKPWLCFVKTENWQFETDEGIYAFSIDDELPNEILLIDGTGGKVPFYIINKDSNGKYKIDRIAEKVN